MDEFVTLSGDLLFERKKLSESLKRLEQIISSSSLSSQLGSQNVIKLQTEMDQISHGISRLDALARMLTMRAQTDGYSSSESFLHDAVIRVQESAKRLGRSLSIRPSGSQALIDRHKVDSFKPVFFEMLDAFLEFSTETPRERSLRGKQETVNFKILLRRDDDGVRLTMIADGNGLIPPLVEAHGQRLARIGVRASFEGKPGHWSCWVFHIPSTSVIGNCIKARFGGNYIYLPSNFVLKVKGPQEFSSFKTDADKTFILDDSFERVPANAVAGIGKNPKVLLEVAAGVHTIFLLADEVGKREEVFMKPLLGPFTGNGRFLGVVVETEQGEQMLNIVMNPSYIVYGIMQGIAGYQGELRDV